MPKIKIVACERVHYRQTVSMPAEEFRALESMEPEEVIERYINRMEVCDDDDHQVIDCALVSPAG